MCRASVLHARCSMRMLPQDGSIVQAGRGKSSFQAASEEIPSAFYSSLLLLAVSKLLQERQWRRILKCTVTQLKELLFIFCTYMYTLFELCKTQESYSFHQFPEKILERFVKNFRMIFWKFHSLPNLILRNMTYTSIESLITFR